MLNICDGCRWWQKLKDWDKEKEKAGWYSVFLVRKAITSFPLDTISTAHQLCLFLYLFVTPLFSSSSSFLTYQPSPFHFPLCFFPNLPFAHFLITPLRLICPLFFPPSLSIVWLTFVWISFCSTYSFRCFRRAGHSPLTPCRPPVLLVSTDWDPLWDGQFCRREYNGRPTSLCYPPCMYDWIIQWIGTFLHTCSLACQNTSFKEPKFVLEHLSEFSEVEQDVWRVIPCSVKLDLLS